MRFDPQAVVSHIEQRLSLPPRDTSEAMVRQFQRERPAWTFSEDPISQIYDRLREIIERGEVRWASVIHANETVFAPGPHMSGAQIVYDAAGESSLEALNEAAKKCYETKHGDRANDEELRLGEMLANEMQRALDWPLPRSITGGAAMFTSIVMLPRENTPYRFMAMKQFPILADPETRLVALVPQAFWDDAFLRAWKREAIKTLLTLDLMRENA